MDTVFFIAKLLLILFGVCVLVSFFAGYFIRMLTTKSFEKVFWKKISVKRINRIIKAGADVNHRNEQGITPLMFAANRNGDPAVIEALVKAGADVNAGDAAGATALMLAVGGNKNPAVIEALIKAGADINARDNEGRTIFDYAEQNPEIKQTPIYWELNLKYKK